MQYTNILSGVVKRYNMVVQGKQATAISQHSYAVLTDLRVLGFCQLPKI